MKKLKIEVDLSLAIFKEAGIFFVVENLIPFLFSEGRSHIDQAGHRFIEIHLPLCSEC